MKVGNNWGWVSKTQMAAVRMAKVGWDSLTGDSEPSSHQLGGLKECCKLPSGIRGGVLAAQRFLGDRL